MFEKVNPSHPDKMCDRIGGAIVDLGYEKKETPRIAGECMLGHGDCHIIIETDVDYKEKEIKSIVERIAGDVRLDLKIVPQDTHLAKNQEEEIRCGDNGIFKGEPTISEERKLSNIVRSLYELHPYDGKFIYDLNANTLIACQSNVKTESLRKELALTGIEKIIINPLGDWTGGPSVDVGACNRKLGSDIGRAVTGGGLHFKDISKADVSINVYLFIEAQKLGRELFCKCAIGDTEIYIPHIGVVSYEEITKVAQDFIKGLGGFEELAEWGLV